MSVPNHNHGPGELPPSSEILVDYVPVNYTVTGDTLDDHLGGIDDALGSGGGGGGTYADNVSVTWGNWVSGDPNLGNVLATLVDTGSFRAFALGFTVTPLQAAAGTPSTVQMLIASPSVVTTTAGTPVNTGNVGFSSGSTDGLAGADAGNTGNASFGSGSAVNTTGGAHGNTGTSRLRSGDGASAGEVSVQPGTSRTSDGTNLILAGGDSLVGRPGDVSLEGSTGASGKRGAIAMNGGMVCGSLGVFNANPLVCVVTAAVGNWTYWAGHEVTRSLRLMDFVLYITGAGSPGNSLTLSTPAGVWAVIDLSAVSSGDVIRPGSAEVTMTISNGDLTDGQNFNIARSGSVGFSIMVQGAAPS